MSGQVLSRLPWRKFAAEFIGTAVLLFFGLSLVIVMFGAGNPVAKLLPDVRVRMIASGFLFGCVGGSIAISHVGKYSGAHINPMVTLVFWLFGKLESPVALGYVLAQLAGGIAGCLPLLAWGPLGRSISFGATVPGEGYTTWDAILGEALTTFGLVTVLCLFIGFRHLRQFTPAVIPVLYAIMVPLEAPVSGTSTNPARSLGPAVISGEWHGWWIYWLGPFLGTLACALFFSRLKYRIEEARLYYFEAQPRRIPRKGQVA